MNIRTKYLTKSNNTPCLEDSLHHKKQLVVCKAIVVDWDDPNVLSKLGLANKYQLDFDVIKSNQSIYQKMALKLYEFTENSL